MDRTNISRNGTAGAFCAMVMLLIAAQSFGVVTNGFFDTSIDYWQNNDATRVVWSPTGVYDEPGNGTALLQQTLAADDGSLPTSPDSSRLSQTFYVNPNSTSLSFQVRTPVPIISETDHFYIQLLNSASVPVLNSSSNDYFFHWKSGTDAEGSGGWLASETPDGVNITESVPFFGENPDISSQYLLYSFDIPVAPAWFDSNLTLQFTLNNDYADENPTSILIDSVELHVQSPDPVVVPIPSAIGLVLTGLTALGIFKKKLA